MAKLKTICKQCEGGRHRTYHPRCGLDMCSCWCLLGESALFRPAPKLPEWHHEDLAPTLAVLREHNVACKAKSDGSLVWKPRPSDLPAEVATLIREKKLLLACVLTPDRQPDLRPRHYWTHGTTTICTGCERLTVMRDPLGTPRHHYCGWLHQLRHH